MGGIGVHRFYLGQTGLGFLYLIFCWTFIPAIIAFVDFIIFLTMSEEQFNLKYNTIVDFRNSNTAITQSSESRLSTADELEKLFNLKEKGIISDAEFQSRKVKLL